MKTSFSEKQYRKIVKLAIEKGIVVGRLGQSIMFKKTDSELAEMHLAPFIDDMEAVMNEGIK